ncbi:phosphatidate phosphatase App1 family protein [Blastopirellula marina]|uniref:Phosphatidate phosphatase APP1 catalytic domain-containing protein n=1 Tax=Blastopirellula marina DSM 3645 TaxID=314230 RepID=A4A161_9BACT|nr:phosphatase domain-containing protein [Blastopirellula marina]EAQ77521.1 hypothetical protein DSM3645_06659 [Blastopirellula marina DSM 3645]
MQPDDMAVTDLTASQSVVVYPTYGYPSADGRRWVVEVHGCIFEKVPDNLPRWIMLRLLARLMDASPEDLQTEIFQQRILGFTVYKHRGKQIVVEIGQRRYRLRERSGKNGQFRGKIEIDREAVESYLESSAAGVFLPFQLVIDAEDERSFPARIQLLEHAGMSIISDIDDTVKHTDVAARKAMLANTFLKEFTTVPGVTELFKAWEDQGAAFHYVTSSPWQLFTPLADLFVSEGLPGGTFHMKSIRFRDPSVLRLFIARRWGKRKAIKHILQTFPSRKFVLVGDSGEKDPETYGVIARKFPQQVERIYIRDLSGKNSHPARYARAFHSLPDKSWQVFREPCEIVDRLLSSPELPQISSRFG